MSNETESTNDFRSYLPLVIAGFAISFVLVGGGIDTVSVFINAVSKATNWSRSSMSLGVSVGAACAALATPIVGIAVDRFGVRVPMWVGVGLLTGGFLILESMTQSWHFAAANVLLGPGFAACALLPITVAVSVLIPTRTALALGIVAAGSSAGALVLAPVTQAVIDVFGWRGAYVAMGLAVVLTPVPFLLFVLPRGRLARPGGEGQGGVSKPATSLAADLRRPGVAALAGVMILPALAGFSVSVHIVPYLTGLGHSAPLAAAALGGTIGVSAVGKIFGGLVADRIGALLTLRLALVVWAVAFVLLAGAESTAVLAAFVLLYGMALGTQIAVVPAIAVGLLGTARFGALFGILQLAAMLASAVGPLSSGMIFDATGAYSGAIVLWLAAMTMAAAVSFSMSPAAGAGAATKQVAA